MKKRPSFVILTILFYHLTICTSVAQPLQNRNDYLGFPKPGSEPEIFAPGLISTVYAEFAGTFSPDFQEYYFTRRGPFPGGIAQVMVTYKTQDGWTEPVKAPFSTDNYEFEPCITPDGLRLYYGSRRSPDGILPPGQMHQWYLDRINGVWTGPELLGDPFFDIMVMYPSIALDTTFYFTGMDGIYVSEYQDMAYMEPVKMGPEINFLPMTAHSYIAPDESYLIFDGQIRGEGLSDLFISYRRADGSWCKGKFMGKCVNSGESQAIASVSPDGECLFFTREQDIYWMDASVIDELRLIPAISCSRDSGHIPMNVKFSLDLSTVPVTIEAVEWDLDNDGEVDSYSLDPEFTYLEQGSYAVALKVFSAGDSATWIWEDFIFAEDTAGFGMVDQDATKDLHYLYQNFPNPFTNETTIKYTLSNDAHVQLEVFDILGNKIAKLVDELQRPGSYKFVYNPLQSGPGSFLYRLYTGNQYLVRMMIKK